MKRKLALLFTAGFILILGSGVHAQTVARGYGSNEVLQRGMIVGLEADDPNKVKAIDLNDMNNILGVIVNQNDSPITVSDELNRIFVASTGNYDVLVSTQNGDVTTNSYISLSSVGGIGMKADNQQSTVIGRAMEGFDGKSGSLATITVKHTDNKEKQIQIGRVKVELNIGRNPLAKGTENTPAFLSQTGNTLAGRPVSAIRLYLSAIVFLIGLFAAFAILYAGIRSSIVAIGRNPLGRRSIYRSLFGVSVTALFVFIVSIIAVYLLLKL